VLLATCVARAAAADTLPFEGRWATQSQSCASDAGSTGGTLPITVTASRLEVPPLMVCDFTSVLPGGISFRVEAACEVEGQHGNEFFTFAVLAGRLYWSWGGKTVGFERCAD